ncbi:chemotaxis protein CheW [Moritella sp. 5]|uniref:chemotaxis protein CheW n=1 Tax=Moritella sp. 5 TaxID=2746231 RepID=UPI001BACD16F|nr:chemotaxis protein CheW [Moritella sp. 5]QUM79766.1 chemotaxis protein CheW [Moritella sp. 5]
MDKHTKHSALDDYFTSMLSEPVVENTQDAKAAVEQTVVLKPALKKELTKESQKVLTPLFSEIEPTIKSDFKIPEPDGSGSLSDLDQLLGSVIDIDLADIDLSVLDNIDVTTTQSTSEVEATDTMITITPTDIIVSETALAIEPAENVSVSDVERVQESEPVEQWKNIELEEHFQALFFEVAGVIFAVPLTELGGIHQTETINSLFGKPDWYLGLMQHREQKLSVVDTAQWVMPEQNMGEIDYKYQIQLSQSNWVLGCESLHGTETLNSNDIKWRSTPGSRPWLAGMVKSRMCVLLHVTEMIKLLDNGINIHGQ